MYGHESREGHVLHERPYGFEFRAVRQTLTNLDRWKRLVFGPFQQQFAVIEAGNSLPSHDAALPQPVGGMSCDELARIPIGRIDLKFLAIRERSPGGVFR